MTTQYLLTIKALIYATYFKILKILLLAAIITIITGVSAQMDKINQGK